MAAPLLQTYGPANIDETLTGTLVNMRPGIKDNIFNANPALRWFKGTGRVTIRGGPSISHGIMYGTNSTAKAYSRYGQLDVTPQNGLTRDQWVFKQYSASITIDGFTTRTNRGEEEIVDLLDTKRTQAEESLSLKLEQDLFASSTATDSFESLAVIVLASGTVGDINGTTNTWWQSLVTASGSWPLQGRKDVQTAINTISLRNPVGKPSVLISDQTSVEAYQASVVPHLRISDTRLADLGVPNITFDGIAWFWSPQATSGVIYLLNERSINLYVNSATDMITTKFVTPVNQDAGTAHILFMGATATGNRRKLGKLTGVTE